MYTLLWILLVTIIDGALAFAGALTLTVKELILHKILFAFVAFAAGAMIAGALLQLLVQSLSFFTPDTTMLICLAGFSSFFLIERILHWHHCNIGQTHEAHSYGYMVAIGDAIHNLVDGLVIAATFMTGTGLGLVTSLLVLAHEIPQEMGDFCVIINAGVKKRKALLYNFASQMTSVVGGLLGYFVLSVSATSFLIPFAAGGFLYIASSDLMPELYNEPKLKKSLLAFAFFVLGILTVVSAKYVVGTN